MTKQELFDLLFQQFEVINANRDTLIAKATTAEQAEQVLDAWRQANLNQLTMGNKILINDSPDLEDLVTQINAAQGQVQEALQQLEQIAATIEQVNSTINLITSAVALGTKLVALA